eukprot:TRINITY_DN14462_c0_g1_i1.p1 TRINITY_DN14462_c0_g1~~TRINITY_DN14462_c0_g1_i1.p1  ORF type:complete len:279 (-),score=95.64 TRINITY_DN14462_c0_g1_i1:29-865(-)
MEHSSLKEKYDFVHDWLIKKYGKSIPLFEMKERNIDILYQIALLNERKNEMEIEKNRIKERFIEQYKSECIRIQRILNELGIFHSISNISSLQQIISILSSSSLQLQIKNTELSSFFCSIQSLQEDQFKRNEDQKESLKHHKYWKDQLLSSQFFLQHLEKVLNSASQTKEGRKQVVKKQMDNLEYLGDKEKEYNRQLTELKQLLAESGVEQSILHPSLVQLKSHIEQIQKQVENNNKTLEAFHFLPPDIPLARIKISEAQKRLDQLDEQLNNAVNQFV